MSEEPSVDPPGSWLGRVDGEMVLIGHFPDTTGPASGVGNSEGESTDVFSNGEFDSGSERTLAAWIRHASRTIIKG